MYQAIVFLPLIGALVAGLLGSKMFRNMGSDAEVYGEHHAHGLRTQGQRPANRQVSGHVQVARPS